MAKKLTLSEVYDNLIYLKNHNKNLTKEQYSKIDDLVEWVDEEIKNHISEKIGGFMVALEKLQAEHGIYLEDCTVCYNLEHEKFGNTETEYNPCNHTLDTVLVNGLNGEEIK